jgi:hypothetical protein
MSDVKLIEIDLKKKFNMNIQTNLRVPRLILQILKLTTM